jgi:hypothetical protein
MTAASDSIPSMDWIQPASSEGARLHGLVWLQKESKASLNCVSVLISFNSNSIHVEKSHFI